MKRVVITGMGCVSPFGIGVDKAWDAVTNGKSGIRQLTVDIDKQLVKIGGEVPEYNAEDYVDAKEAKRLDKFILYAIMAADEAAKSGNFDIEKEDPYRVGVVIGSAQGGLSTMAQNHEVMLQRGYYKCSPFTVPMMIPNMAAGKVSIRLGAKGMNKAIATACATGAHSIGDAYRSIQYGDADIIFAGGTDSKISNFGVGAFTSAKTLSKRNDEPEKASRPYDKERDGFVMSEGAAVLMLEEYEHAKARGAKIYAEIVGYGQSADAYDMVAPDPNGKGAEYAMNAAMKDAGISIADVDYINAHGTSTHVGDIAESKTIERIFGNKDSNKKLLVSSTKSMTGHMLGAAGAIEAIFAIETTMNDIVPPTINLENQDEEVGDLDYVPNKAREHKVEYALSNSFGFGGTNAVLIFKKYN
ncbi:MAG: beta-ketoacyl-ACP synthase II [bacterium]|nr:beta-ketoacyl-ACP synthase II [bacterium]